MGAAVVKAVRPSLRLDVRSNVLLALARFADDEGRCRPTRRSIARSAGCSLKTVSAALRELKAQRLVAVEKRRTAGRQAANEYLVLPGRSAKAEGNKPKPPARLRPQLRLLPPEAIADKRFLAWLNANPSTDPFDALQEWHRRKALPTADE